MSSHIIYDLKVVRMPIDASPENDRFGLFILSGSSNTYNGWGKNARRSRDWGMIYSGTKSDLMAFNIDWSNSFRGANSVWRNTGKSGYVSPQQWIRKTRRAIDAAQPIPIFAMDHQCIQVGDLFIAAKREFEGQTIGQILQEVEKFTAANPGSCTWQFLRVTGPDN